MLRKDGWIVLKTKRFYLGRLHFVPVRDASMPLLTLINIAMLKVANMSSDSRVIVRELGLRCVYSLFV